MAKKLYYKIGEACKLLEIQPYVLRYWETEFPFLKPSKSKSGQRVYQEAQLTLIQRVKELLYDEEYTIAGAKKKLEAELADGSLKAVENKASSSRKSSRPSAKSKPPGKKAEAVAVSKEAIDSRQMEKYREGVQNALEQLSELLDRLERSAPSR